MPRIDAAQHRLLLRVPSPGGVRAHELSMDALRAMPSRSVAVTLACAGLRRKEVAMVAPVDGFNWGAASLGTCVWTGAPLAHVLRGAGVTEPSDEMQFVCFAGVPGETPLGEGGTYGTSIPLSFALDPAADVLLAYEHNGEALTPDHGFPLRALVPGGTGITPVFQVLQAASNDPDDETHMSLIYCNKTPADILLRKELDALVAARPDRLRVWYVVDSDEPRGPDDAKWEHSTGLLSADIIAAHLPPAAASTAVFLCGPPGMERAARKMLKQLGYDESRTADF